MYKITIKRDIVYPRMETAVVRGEDVQKICQAFGMEPSKGSTAGDYVNIKVPNGYRDDETLYEQRFEEIDVAAIVAFLNRAPVQCSAE